MRTFVCMGSEKSIEKFVDTKLLMQYGNGMKEKKDKIGSFF